MRTMTILLNFIIIASLTYLPAFAKCPNAVRLNVGDAVVDCDRIGLSLEYDKQVRTELIEGSKNKQIMEKQTELLTIKDLIIDESKDRAGLWEKEAARVRKENDELRSGSDWKWWVGIFTGIGLTVLSGWAIGQVK